MLSAERLKILTLRQTTVTLASMFPRFAWYTGTSDASPQPAIERFPCNIGRIEQQMRCETEAAFRQGADADRCRHLGWISHPGFELSVPMKQAEE